MERHHTDTTMPTEMVTDELWRDSEIEQSPQQYFDAKEELYAVTEWLSARRCSYMYVHMLYLPC